MKKQEEARVNLERWMVSYADFMTLLFALFVVLYSFAMAKQSEMQSMAQSIAESFNESIISNNNGVLMVPEIVAEQLSEEAQKNVEQQQSVQAARQVIAEGGMVMSFVNTSSTVQQSEDVDSESDGGSEADSETTNISDSQQTAGDLIMSETPESNHEVQRTQNPEGGADSGEGGLTPGGSADVTNDGGRTSVDTENKGEGKFGNPFDTIRESVSNSLSELGMSEQIDIQQDEHWLMLNISSGMLFAEGSASILSASRPLIARIAVVLSNINNFVRIRGYTDNTFVPDGIYKNSWDLSAQRAVNVLGELESDGIDPRRMAVEAYGEHSPFYSNTTPQGRAQNRRVVIAISRYAMAARDLQVMGADGMPVATEAQEGPPQGIKDEPEEGGGEAVSVGDGGGITLDFN